MAEKDQQEDPLLKLKFFGSIHDVMQTNTVEFRSVSIYNPLAIKIAASEIARNPESVAIIDYTGKLVSDIYLSRASDMAVRASKCTSKKAKNLSTLKAEGKLFLTY